MTPSDIRQEFIGPLFQPGHNIIGRVVFAPMPEENRKRLEACLLLDYKGILASDKHQPHDNAVRAAANRAYKPAKAPVAEWADAWMAKHPDVYPLFVRFALEIASKRTRFSAKAIVERLRWETAVRGGLDFKIANAVTAYLARRFVRDFPEHASLFLMAKRGGAV